MKGFWLTLILVTLIAPGDPQIYDQEIKEQNLSDLIDSALYGFNMLDPIVLKKCVLLRHTVFLGVCIHGLRAIRRSRNITLSNQNGVIDLTVYLQVEGLVLDFEFRVSEHNRIRSPCAIKLPPVSGFLVIRHGYKATLQQLQIDKLDRRNVDFTCEGELPNDLTRRLTESLKMAMDTERIKIENVMGWYGRFAVGYLHLRKVMYRRFCAIGLPDYCDPDLDYQP